MADSELALHKTNKSLIPSNTYIPQSPAMNTETDLSGNNTTRHSQKIKKYSGREEHHKNLNNSTTGRTFAVLRSNL